VLKRVTGSNYFFSPEYDLQNSVSQVQEAQTHLSAPKSQKKPQNKNKTKCLALFYILSHLWNLGRWEVVGIGVEGITSLF